MTDTPENILQKQFEIYNSLSVKEKFENLFDLTELSRQIIINRIREEFPGISELELKIELFKRFYKTYFDEAAIKKITDYFRTRN